MEYASKPRFKSSTGKAYIPRRKQVLRFREDGRGEGRITGDRLVPFARASADASHRTSDLEARGRADDHGLLRPLVRDGEPVTDARSSLAERRRRIRSGMAALPQEIRALAPATEPYPVAVDRDEPA